MASKTLLEIDNEISTLESGIPELQQILASREDSAQQAKDMHSKAATPADLERTSALLTTREQARVQAFLNVQLAKHRVEELKNEREKLL
jgi:hypothetical protein